MRDIIQPMNATGPLQAFSNLLTSRPVNDVRRPSSGLATRNGAQAPTDRVASGMARRAAALAEGRTLPRGSLLDMLV